MKRNKMSASKDCSLPYCARCVSIANLRNSKVMLRLKKGMESNLKRGDAIEYQLSSHEWRKLDFDISDKRRTDEIAEAVTNHSPLELISKKELTRKNVHLVEDKEGKKYILKQGIEAREALLQRDLFTTIQQHPQLRGMVPQVIQVDQANHWVDMAMEYVEGNELAVEIHNMNDKKVRDTLLVLHLLLHTTNAEVFVHGDFYPSNVLLRRGERTWSFDVDEENREVTLPFCPVVIDFEHSSSITRSYFGVFTSPLTSQSTDILRLYTWMLQYVPSKVPKSIADLILSIVGEENIVDDQAHFDYQYIPLPFAIPSLTHAEMIRLLLELE